MALIQLDIKMSLVGLAVCGLCFAEALNSAGNEYSALMRVCFYFIQFANELKEKKIRRLYVNSIW